MPQAQQTFLGYESMHPSPTGCTRAGYVSTNMSSYRGYKHVSEGADTPCWLALLVPQGTTGGWFTEREQQSF